MRGRKKDQKAGTESEQELEKVATESDGMLSERQDVCSVRSASQAIGVTDLLIVSSGSFGVS